MSKYPMRILVIILIFFSSNSYAQSIKGSITDTTEKKNVSNVVIALLTPKDSILYKFVRTGANGSFELNNIKPGNYILMITHPFYADYLDDITLSSKGLNLNSISVIPKSKLLQEIILKSGSPIKIKGDTVVYTADSFKVSANANVEELLKKLPGIQVDKNGQIKAMGEKVEKVLVDGEEFFGDDPGMAIKNLRADAVKEVQVFDKKSDQATFTGIDDGQTKKTINLKLKDDKKHGYFGKIELAGGLQNKIDNRYNNNLMLNSFRGKRKFAGYLLMGNVGQSGLNWQEQQKFGGEDENMTMNMDEDGGFMSMYRGGNDEDPYIDTRNGFFENLNTGLQYSNKWNDKHTLNYSPKFNRQQYNLNKSTFSQLQNGDSVFNNNANENTFVRKQSVKNNLTYDVKLDSVNSLKITTKLNVYNTKSRIFNQSQNTNKFGVFNNNSSNITDNNTDRTSFTTSAIFKHKFKKNRRTFSFNTDFNLLNSSNNGYLNSINNYYYAGLLTNTDSIDQKKNNEKKNSKIAAKAVYTEPLSKDYSLELNYELSWTKGKNNLTTLGKTVSTSTKYDEYIDSLSNNFDQQIITNKPGIKISYKHKKIKYGFGTGLGFTHFNLKDISYNRDYNRNYTNIFPSANFQYSYKPNHNFTVNYNGNTIQPSLNQLQQLRNNNNPLSEYIGNPLLSQSFQHTVSIMHNTYNFLKEMWTYQSLNFITTDNAITNSTTIQSTGKTITQPINTNGNFSVNGWLGTGKKIKKIKADIFISTQFNFSKFNERINNVKNKNENSNVMLTTNISKTKDKKYEFSIGNDLGYNVNKTSVYNRTIKFITNTVNLNATVYIKKVWKISSDAEINYRQKTSDFAKDVNNNLWNAQIERTFRKDEFTVFAGIKDILNENIGIDRSLYGNTLTEVRTDRLQRYWMVGLRWDFKNKKGKK